MSEPEPHSDPDESRHPVDCENGWIMCWACGGEGDEHDCGDDCCPCADPESDDRVACSECHGEGGHSCPVCQRDEV